jgi:hypothetical protein
MPMEFTPPAFQLEENEAWFRFKPALKDFFHFEVVSTFTNCANALADRITKQTEKSTLLINDGFMKFGLCPKNINKPETNQIKSYLT